MSVRKYREKLQTNIWKIYKASLWRNLSTGTPPKFFSAILCLVVLVYNWYVFQNSRFTEIIRHYCFRTNTIISHTFAYSSRWCRKLWQGLFRLCKTCESLASHAFYGELVFHPSPQAFVGRDERRAPLKTPAWEANERSTSYLLFSLDYLSTLLAPWTMTSFISAIPLIETNTIKLLP